MKIIMFQPLSQEDIRKVVEIQFSIIKKRLAENNIKLEADDKVLDFLGEIGFDPQFGARPLKRVMQKHLLNELSMRILDGKISPDSIIGVTLDKHQNIEFINLNEVKI
jgi:ATP-dependent Clp protease ATP-binding subunit ClpB